MGQDEEYLPVRREDEEQLLEGDSPQEYVLNSVQRHAQQNAWAMRFGVSAVLNVVLVFVAALAWAQSTSPTRTSQVAAGHEIYTPAHSAVEYKQVVFIAGTKNRRSPYQGSSKEVDTLWEDLYNDFGISKIPADAASQLPNATMPIHSDPSSYMVQLDVFHQLHCLNLMRKMVYPEKYPLDLTEENVDHLEHCYDQLRQSVQCHADLATIYWEWVPELEEAFGNLATTHTCKDFDKVREWAQEHSMRGDIDLKVSVKGAPIRHLADWGDQDHVGNHFHSGEHHN